MPNPAHNRRLFLLALGGLALLAALWAGLIRLGWQLPPLRPALAGDHGPLMISGFLGAVISLERAVALTQVKPEAGRRWPYLAPLLAGLGGLALIVGLPPLVARGLIVAGSLALTAIFFVIVRARADPPHLVMGLGAVLWLAGNVLWLFAPTARVVPWWMGFLVVTIAGERLELARVLSWTRSTRAMFLVAVGVFAAGLIVTLVAFDGGLRLAGLGLIALGLWLARYDIARRTIRQSGLTRFLAACLLPGYVWLMVSGALWLIYGGQYTAGPIYDALLHTLSLGFVFSMIFGHAPIIVPAVTGIPIGYRPAFYFHLALLHLSLLLRVSGDLAAFPALRMWGGLLNVLAILVFLFNTARARGL